LSALQVVNVNGNNRIGFTRFGVFVAVIGGVELIVNGKVVLCYLTFVKFIVANPLSVGRPETCPGESKFFFINPIGSAVNDFVVFSIGGDLPFRSGFQLLDEIVVVPYKGYARGVGRNGGVFLPAVFRQGRT